MESLERIPAEWKVVVHVREKMACRRCDTIVQAPAPSHPISRGRAGPSLLTEIAFSKYRAHQPLNRQRDIYANEGVAQMLFFQSDEVCETSYKDRGGKYQGQTGVTLPRT